MFSRKYSKEEISLEIKRAKMRKLTPKNSGNQLKLLFPQMTHIVVM